MNSTTAVAVLRPGGTEQLVEQSPATAPLASWSGVVDVVGTISASAATVV
jgi:hypothetical protein